MTNLVIVESPAKTKKIQGFLGSGWQVLASYGHFRDLPQKSLGVEPPSFKPKYVVSDNGERTLATLKKAAASADNIYLATDLDREGEAIAWHIKDALKLKDPKRITFGEITEKAVKAAIASPRTINMDLVRAQEGRRVLDRLVGYMVSPALSGKANRSGLSAGRVQSPAVRIIVDREREIHSFVSVQHYSALLKFNGPVNWSAELDTKPLITAGEDYLTDKSVVEALLNVKTASVKAIEKKPAKRGAPAAFITSTLQQAASIALGMNPKETMSHAQALFDNGLITYHRTDNLNLSDDAISEIKDFANANGYAEYIPDTPNTWKSSAGSQEAHEAIRPTDFNRIESGTGDEKRDKLYQLIRLRALASQFKPAVYDTTKIILNANQNGHDYSFIAKGSVEIEKGWKILIEKDQTTEEDTEQLQALPELAEGQQLDVSETELLTKKTAPPSRYSEAALIKKMESEGIGRPSTYASIIDNIKGKNYVVVEKKKLIPTEIGELVVDALTEQFQFIELGYTKEIESKLDLVAGGKAEYLPLITEIHSALSAEISGFHKADAIGPVFPCPECQKPMALRPGKFGPFWACTGYPECKTTLPDNDGEPGEKKPKPAIDEAAPDCPDCDTGKLVERNGKKGVFLGCSNFPKCKHTAEVKGKSKK